MMGVIESEIDFDQPAIFLHPRPLAGRFALAHQQGQGGGHSETLETADGDLVF